MILIADSGSTKTDWCLVKDGNSFTRIKTAGMNPFFQTEEEMSLALKEQLLPLIQTVAVEKVFFYGAGCIPEKVSQVRCAFEKVLTVPVEVESDLLGAARALCGHKPGIACILGTGSNSCFYNGEKIVGNVPPLGYVLGDEAGGAHLGRCLLREYLRGGLSPECEKAFFDEYGLDREEILDRIYKQPFPNRFLASFASFLPPLIKIGADHRLRSVIRNCFQKFFDHCVKQYDYRMYEVNAIGSIAWHFRDLIREVADEEGIILGEICQSPMEGLLAYHGSVTDLGG